jgi:hypothetical protein
MLSQLGYLSLPEGLVEKAHYGEPLSADEQVLLGGVPRIAIRLLDQIPRLEPVLQILTALDWDDDQVKRLGDGTTFLERIRNYGPDLLAEKVKILSSC